MLWIRHFYASSSSVFKLFSKCCSLDIKVQSCEVQSKATVKQVNVKQKDFQMQLFVSCYHDIRLPALFSISLLSSLPSSVLKMTEKKMESLVFCTRSACVIF